jgi:hypothetical protein
MHNIFRDIRIHLQEDCGFVEHPTTIIKIKMDFATLPNHLRDEFLRWANSHRDAHIKDIDEPEPIQP